MENIPILRIAFSVQLLYFGCAQNITNIFPSHSSAIEGLENNTTVVLPCIITPGPLTPGKAVLWGFREVGGSSFETIYFGRRKAGVWKEKHTLEGTDNNYTLIINNANCSDIGRYQCSILGSLDIHKLKQIDLNIGKFSGGDSVKCMNQTGNTTCTVDDTKPNATLIVTKENGDEVVSNNVLDSLEDVTCETESFPNAPVTFPHPITTDTYILVVKLGDIQVYSRRFPFQIGSDTTTVTVESTTTTKSTTGGPVPSPTVTVDDDQPPVCDWKLCIPLILGLLGLALVVCGGALTGYLWKEKKCPCQQSSGNVPYEFEIDGVKEDKTIEISPGILIRLAATCYGAKPPASIQWCISYNGKDPVDMTEKDYGNSDALNTSVTTNKRDPKTSDTHSKLEMVPNEDHDGAVIHCVAITKISADEEKWDLKTSPKITLKLKKGQVGDYPGQGGYYQGQGGDYRHQGGDYRGQDGYHQGQGGDNHGQGGNYHRHVGQAGQEYQPHGNTRNDKDPFPQPGKRPNALEPIQGQRTLTPIGDIEKTSFKKKRQTNKQTSEL